MAQLLESFGPVLNLEKIFCVHNGNYAIIFVNSVDGERVDVLVLEAAEDGAAVENGEHGGGGEGQQDHRQDIVVHKHLGKKKRSVICR